MSCKNPFIHESFRQITARISTMLLLGYKITSKNKNTSMATTRMKPTQAGVLKNCFTIPSRAGTEKPTMKRLPPKIGRQVFKEGVI